MSYQAMNRHGGNLNAYDQVKEGILKWTLLHFTIVLFYISLEGTFPSLCTFARF